MAGDQKCFVLWFCSLSVLGDAELPLPSKAMVNVTISFLL